ncbi:hypothetical protein RMSM_03848 [Rhodopirellula maiorica SM1]|uniref:Uncharacterized protein n=1 Tax=Rhodopirellula maiorica SM1 TaxID=1265738 RepID=M5RUX7_9BACT|nr:hypothetical protein RMSM_03848 [Rhodopirellula maiorica SM1]
MSEVVILSRLTVGWLLSVGSAFFSATFDSEPFAWFGCVGGTRCDFA